CKIERLCRRATRRWENDYRTGLEDGSGAGTNPCGLVRRVGGEDRSVAEVVSRDNRGIVGFDVRCLHHGIAVFVRCSRVQAKRVANAKQLYRIARENYLRRLTRHRDGG